MRLALRTIITLALAVLVIAVAIPWQPVDIILVAILGIAHIHGERAALWGAIMLGLVLDLFSAAPFGLLLAAYPAILGALYLLGHYVVTNRSLWSLVANAIVGTLLLHGGAHWGETASVFLSRQHFAIDIAHHLPSALVTNTVALVLWIVARNYLVRRYESRFLRRGEIVKTYSP